ncbi:helix-turn-helix domain-containing protein [uncultured Draconibacterium sp.]|uniref:helix-turn-helix transcriptional regulator n=1 Tax=uncultured Draconibacterium sp. TaxID=1573823 RepID=UPI0025ECC5BD|nr:helix-turn-helix domain-containing protein [uncultured Draconibacterium sp.]
MNTDNFNGEERIHQRFLSVNDLCKYTSLCKSSIYKLVKEDSIPYLRPNKRVVFDRVAIDEWMLNGCKKPVELPNIDNL